MAGIVLQAIAEKIDIGKIGDFDSILAQVRDMSKFEIIGFLKIVQSQLPRAHRSNSYFAYSANFEMSGFAAVSSSYALRAKKLKESLYYAACYADQLVLIDPFSHIIKSITEERIDPDFVSEFSFFLTMLVVMDPLLEHGIVTFSDAKGDFYCAECFYKLISEADERIPNVEFLKKTTNTLLKKAQIRLEA